jgi:hypothetical protein
MLQCFDRDGGFLFEDLQAGIPYASEDSGEYSLHGFNVTESVKNAFLNSSTTNVGSLTGSYRRKNDSLIGLLSDGTTTQNSWIGFDPGSFPCGIKPWRVFQKPAGWDSLVIPLQ